MWLSCPVRSVTVLCDDPLVRPLFSSPATVCPVLWHCLFFTFHKPNSYLCTGSNMFFSLWLRALKIVFSGVNTMIEMNTNVGIEVEMAWQSLHPRGHLDISGCTYVNDLRWSLKWKHKFKKLPLWKLWRLWIWQWTPVIKSTQPWVSATLLFSAFSHPQVRNAPGPADGHSEQRALLMVHPSRAASQSVRVCAFREDKTLPGDSGLCSGMCYTTAARSSR